MVPCLLLLWASRCIVIAGGVLLAVCASALAAAPSVMLLKHRLTPVLVQSSKA
jgi:hypothetical protein